MSATTKSVLHCLYLENHILCEGVVALVHATFLAFSFFFLDTRPTDEVAALFHALTENELTEYGCRCLMCPSGCCQFPFFILVKHSLIVSSCPCAFYWMFNDFLVRDI